MKLFKAKSPQSTIDAIDAVKIKIIIENALRLVDPRVVDSAATIVVKIVVVGVKVVVSSSVVISSTVVVSSSSSLNGPIFDAYAIKWGMLFCS